MSFSVVIDTLWVLCKLDYIHSSLCASWWFVEWRAAGELSFYIHWRQVVSSSCLAMVDSPQLIAVRCETLHFCC